MKWLGIAFIIYICMNISMAGVTTIAHSPSDVTVKRIFQGAQIQWKYDLPDTVLSFNNSAGLGIWEIKKPKKGLGVVFNLNNFPGTTLEQIDFVHFGNGKMAGPSFYNIHIFDMDNEQLIAVIDSQIAGDAFSFPRSEIGVPLGSIAAGGNVGIFIEPLTSHLVAQNTYFFPVMTTDTSALIPNTSFLCTNVDAPFDPNTTFYDLSFLDPTSTNWVLDLWINYTHSSKALVVSNANGVVKPGRSGFNPLPAAVVHWSERDLNTANKNYMNNTSESRGFFIYRGAKVDNLQKIATVNYEARMFADTQAWEDSTYFYAVAAFNVTSTSKPIPIEYHHHKILNIADARLDQNADFIPDRLNQKVYLKGLVTSPNFSSNTQYFLQDATAGIQLYSGKFSVELNIGDSVFVYGSIIQYKGLTEIEPDTISDIFVFSAGNKVDTLHLVLSGINESLEGRLAVIENVRLENTAAWPAEGSNSSDVKINDGTATVTLFIDKETDLDGWTPPAGGLFRLIGVIDQYSSNTPPNDGYEIRPRSQADFILLTDMETDADITPTECSLSQNFPNPFNPNTTFNVTLPQRAKVQIEVFDILGKQVLSVFKGYLDAGNHVFSVNGAALNSGVYFYAIQSVSFNAVRKMVLIK